VVVTLKSDTMTADQEYNVGLHNSSSLRA